MVKRTRAASIVSSSPSTSIPSTSSNPDNEYIEQEDLRPATRRRTNNTRSKVTEATTSSSSASHSTEVEVSLRYPCLTACLGCTASRLANNRPSHTSHLPPHKIQRQQGSNSAKNVIASLPNTVATGRNLNRKNFGVALKKQRLAFLPWPLIMNVFARRTLASSSNWRRAHHYKESCPV